MPEALAIEAPEISAPPVETPEVETPEVETPEESPKSTPESTPAPDKAADGRSFAGKLRELHKQLMASQDPNDQGAAKQLKELFFNQKALKEAFPGGVQEVLKLKETYEGLGTPEQIQEVQQAAQTLDEIDTKWMAADPSFIDELVTLNPESFKKLTPVALTKFAQVDPEGYQRVMSGILSTTLAQAKMGDQLYLINYALSKGDTAEAQSLIKGIVDWIGNLDKAAKAPAPEQAKPDAEFEQRQQKLEERETEIFNRDLATDYNPWRNQQIDAALRKVANGTKIDGERREIFDNRVVLELVKMHPPDFQENWTRLYAQGNKENLLKYAKGVDSANIVKAVAKVHALLFPGGSPKPKPPLPPGNQPPNSKPAEQGWIKVSARPNPQDIDRGRNRTTDEMIFAGKAILRNGKKVMWDRA